MHSKNISRCQTEELDDNIFKNFSDDSNSPPSTSSNKQTIQKNLQPLKIKIPKQSKPPKCEKEKATCEEKSEKGKSTCETKSNLKRKVENDEEVGNKGFNIDGDMTKFLEHLDHHTKDLFQSTKEVFLLCIYQRNCVQKLCYTKEIVYKNLLCIHSTVENLYKNSAVEMLHLID